MAWGWGKMIRSCAYIRPVAFYTQQSHPILPAGQQKRQPNHGHDAMRWGGETSLKKPQPSLTWPIISALGFAASLWIYGLLPHTARTEARFQEIAKSTFLLNRADRVSISLPKGVHLSEILYLKATHLIHDALAEYAKHRLETEKMPEQVKAFQEKYTHMSSVEMFYTIELLKGIEQSQHWRDIYPLYQAWSKSVLSHYVDPETQKAFEDSMNTFIQDAEQNRATRGVVIMSFVLLLASFLAYRMQKSTLPDKPDNTFEGL